MNPDRTGLPTPAERIDGALFSLRKVPPHAENAFLIATVELHLEKLREELGHEILYRAGEGRKHTTVTMEADNNMVTVHFGAPVAFFSMPAPSAVEFAKELVQKATEAVAKEEK